MPSFEEIQKARILNSFNTDEGLSELTKAEILDIEKGGKRAMIGEKRTFAGREYIKTSDGWKFHGKGTGSKAQSHVAGALEHHVGEKKAAFKKEDIHSIGELISEDGGRILTPTFEGGATVQKVKITGAQFQSVRGDKEKMKDLAIEILNKTQSKPTHKDATDHFVEEDGKHYIDTLDPDSGEKVFKPGDKVHYQDDSGKHHKGTISDREHEDGDMFEVDREGGNADSSIETEELDPKEITNMQYSSEEERRMGEESTKKLKKLQGAK